MAPLSSSLVARLRVQLKLSISRLRMTQQRDMALAKQQRRAMALLLEQYKVESARIRVENVIRSDIITELHEVLELYCELLLARSQLLEANMSTPSTSSSISNATASAFASRKSVAAVSPAIGKNLPDSLTTTQDPGLDEAIRSIIFAAPRTEIKELMQVRQSLLEKFGKEVGQQAMEGIGVAERVLKKLKMDTPTKNLVDAYLKEIARTYGISWPINSESEDDDESSCDSASDDDDDENPDSNQKKSLREKVSEEEKPEKHPEKPLITDVSSATESTIAEPVTSAATWSSLTSKIPDNEQDKEEQFRIRSASSPPRGDVTHLIPSTLRINPPSPRTENVQPRLKLPRLPEGNPSKGKTRKRRRTKRDKAKYAKRKEESVVRDGDNANSEAEADGETMDRVRDKSRRALPVKARKNNSNANGDSDDSGRGGAIPDVDELARRFARLKR